MLNIHQACTKALPIKAVAVHMRATYGQGCANVLTALQVGIGIADYSVAGSRRVSIRQLNLKQAWPALTRGCCLTGMHASSSREGGGSTYA